MQKIPARFAAKIPLGESSKAMASAARTSSASRTTWYNSGSGFTFLTSSAHLIQSNCSLSSSRDRCRVTQSRDEVDANPSFSPSLFASVIYLSTPGNMGCFSTSSVLRCSRSPRMASRSTGRPSCASKKLRGSNASSDVPMQVAQADRDKQPPYSSKTPARIESLAVLYPR